MACLHSKLSGCNALAAVRYVDVELADTLPDGWRPGATGKLIASDTQEIEPLNRCHPYLGYVRGGSAGPAFG
jgi:hypothetical protein